MRPIRLHLGGVAAMLLLLQVALAGVSSLGACCDDDRRADAGMRCCLEGGAGHMCPLMRGQQATSSGELRATCPSGHDEGVPRSGPPGLAARTIEFTIEWRQSAVAEWAIDPVWRPLASPSPPPRA